MRTLSTLAGFLLFVLGSLGGGMLSVQSHAGAAENDPVQPSTEKNDLEENETPRAIRPSEMLHQRLQSHAAATHNENHNWFTVSVKEEQIVSQKPFESGCGIASVLNALRLGAPANRRIDQKIKGLQEVLDAYGTKPSSYYGEGTRIRQDGISGPDLHDIYNDLRKDNGLEPLAGNYLNSKKGETPEELALRIHGLLLNSLKEGEPPIILLNSQAALQNEAKKDFFWEGIHGHFVTIVAIPERPNSDGGFELGYVDSFTGTQENLFVYPEVRNFTATKGHLEWIPNKPFLVISGPSVVLNTDKQPWYARTLIYLHYGIYKE